MKIIQSGFTPRYPQADFAVFGAAATIAQAQPDDVLALQASAITTALKEPVGKAIAAGLRVSIGNAEGGQVTFRRLIKRRPRQANFNANVEALLAWASAAYALAGDKLVIAPMDVDISFDVATGCRLLKWAAEHHVPLIVTNGFRWLFPQSKSSMRSVSDINRHVPWDRTGSPHTFPFATISAAIKSSGAELWTGAGYADGLNAGSMKKAEDFGFAGVYTTVAAWEAFAHPAAPSPAAH